MINWVEERFGRRAVPYIIVTGWIMLGVAGAVATVLFSVSYVALGVGLAVSIPAIFVGLIGAVSSALHLSDRGY